MKEINEILLSPGYGKTGRQILLELKGNDRMFMDRFNKALEYAASNNVKHNEWHIRNWFSDAQLAGIGNRQMMRSFLNISTKEQRQDFFDDFFTLEADGLNRRGRLIMGVPPSPNSLLQVMKDCVNEDKAKQKENLKFIVDFVKSKGYPNVDKYKERRAAILANKDEEKYDVTEGIEYQSKMRRPRP
jgi:hypothetical protein